MITLPFSGWLAASRRNRRMGFVGLAAPFYLGFALGWQYRQPLPFFLGLIGLAGAVLGYWLFSRSIADISPVADVADEPEINVK